MKQLNVAVPIVCVAMSLFVGGVAGYAIGEQKKLEGYTELQFENAQNNEKLLEANLRILGLEKYETAYKTLIETVNEVMTQQPPRPARGQEF
jgi:hypothetical protein